MQLALMFGMPLHVLLNVVSAEEMTLWEAFDEIDPISLHHRVDLAAGVVASTNINKNIPKDKPDALTKPSDFMPVLLAREKEEKAQKPGIDAGGLRAFFKQQIANQETRKAQKAAKGK